MKTLYELLLFSFILSQIIILIDYSYKETKFKLNVIILISTAELICFIISALN